MADKRIAITGAAGRMGREVIRAVSSASDLKFVLAIDHHRSGEDSGTVAGLAPNGVPIECGLQAALERTTPDVLVDFTLPAGLLDNIRTAVSLSVRCVVGTTGLNDGDLNEIDTIAKANQTAVFVAPNFAIGAVLMMQFAEKAAAYMPDVEIVELHHDRKVDSPSGTALLTARRIGAARAAAGVHPVSPPANLVQNEPGARGALSHATGDVPVHSVRLPGFVAHQEVIFGGQGQTLSIRHDSIDRTSFMPGVLLAIRKVGSLAGLVVGLEKLL